MDHERLKPNEPIGFISIQQVKKISKLKKEIDIREKVIKQAAQELRNYYEQYTKELRSIEKEFFLQGQRFKISLMNGGVYYENSR